MNNRVIVIGGSHHNTLGVVRSLGAVGVKPYVIIITDAKSSFVTKSKYIEKSWILKDSALITEFLLENFSSDKEKPIVISCSDAVASELDMNKNKLADKFIIPCSSSGQGKLTEYMDKNLMIDLAKSCGMAVPVSWENSKEVKFPCFVKPLVSKNGAKEDIFIIKTKDELNNYLNEFNGEFLIQEFIDKDFEYQIIGCSLNGGEQIIIPGVSKILRCSERSNTGFLKYISMNDFDCPYIEQCRKFIKAIGFSGLFSIEFIRDKNGKDYFLEINFRNDGNAICVTAAGVNLPYIWYLYNCGEDISKTNISKIQSKYVMPEFNDFLLVLRKKVSFKEWFRDFKRTDCFMEFSKKDIKPFIYRALSILKR